MATCNGNGAPIFSPKLQVEAIQTVIPMKITDPRLSRRISIPKNLLSDDLQRRFHMVLYYNKASEADSGWIVAGWFKESLGSAIVESPIFAGRLRKLDDENGVENFELVSNDSGVRMLEANYPMNMDDFIEFKKKENVENELVFWEDIHETSPQFSPLFYVQVTNFKCGGYSIGISCSLFLADPFGMTTFLKMWSKIHNNLVSQIDSPKIPAFYTPNFTKIGTSPPQSTTTIPKTRNQITQTLIFKNSKNPLKMNNDEFIKNLASKCVEETEGKIGKRISSIFTLLVKEDFENVKMKNCSREEIIKEDYGLLSIILGNWDDLGGDEVRFNGGNKAIHISCWIINGENNEDLVMITPNLDEEDSSEKNIIITVSD